MSIGLLLAAAAGLWFKLGAAPGGAPEAASARSMETAWNSGGSPMPTDDPTAPDGLRTYADGHLIKGRPVRDLFDHFMIGIAEGAAIDVDMRVRAHVAKRLTSPAREEAWDLWQRYRGYLQAESKLRVGAAGASTPDPVEIAQFLESRSRLRWQKLPDVARLWFGDEEAADQRQVERLGIVGNGSLTPTEKARRLAALDARDPAYRAAAGGGATVARLDRIVREMGAEGKSPDAIAAAIAAEGNPAAAERVRQWAAADADWQTRYHTYVSERRAIDQLPAGSIEKERRIAEMRARQFPVPAEAARALALDKAGER